jgi:hypothetical protein
MQFYKKLWDKKVAEMGIRAQGRHSSAEFSAFS